MRRSLLLDADIVAYKFASVAQETYSFGDGVMITDVEPIEGIIAEMNGYIEKLATDLVADDVIVCLSDPTGHYFRKDIYGPYKAPRANLAKPVHLKTLKEYLGSSYTSFARPALEADDVMGILHTHPDLIKGETVIVSIDKDMEQIPGLLFNPMHDAEPREITPYAADYMFYTQCLTGDRVDNYPGCPGIGPVKAAAALETHEGEKYWDIVKGVYESKGLTEEDALVQARCARILRAEDYDFKRKKPILWTPKQ